MKEFQQERFARKLIYSKVTIIVLSILLLILLRATVSLYGKRSEIITERNKKEEELREGEARLREADKKKAFLESERGKEEYIRTTFPVAKEGEGVIIIYDDKKSAVSSVKKEGDMKEKLLRFFRDLFGGGS